MNLDLITNRDARKRAVICIWLWAIMRFIALYPVLVKYGLHPWIFFIIDMGTVPAYVNGWTRLIRTLTDKRQELKFIFKWGVFTFFASTAPYLYAAWAGGRCFLKQAWIILFFLLIFPLVHIIKQAAIQYRQNTASSFTK